MKAIIRKELKENLVWAALGMLGILIMLGSWLWSALDSYNIVAFNNDFTFMTGVSVTIGMFCLGLLQTLPELRPDRWAFLLHRNVSWTRIFLGKMIAAFIIFVVVFLIPWLVVCGIIFSKGITWKLMSFRDIYPAFLMILLSWGCWFSAVLITIRDAKWYGSRFLFLPVLIVPLAFIVDQANRMSSFSLWVCLIITLLTNLCLALAAWGCFVRNGYLNRLSNGGYYSLGILQSVGIMFLLLIGSSFYAGLMFEFDQSSRGEHRYQRYQSDPEGRIWQVTQRSRVPFYQKLPSEIRLVDSLGRTEPKQPPEEEQLAKRAAFHVQAGFHDSTWQRANSTLNTHWRFDSSRKIFLGYRVPVVLDLYEQSYDIPREPKLVSIVTPDGFHSPDEIDIDSPGKTFGRYLNSPHHWNWHVKGKRGMRDSHTMQRFFYTFSSGIYEIDFRKERLIRWASGTETEPVRGLSVIDDHPEKNEARLLILRNSHIEVLSAAEEKVGTFHKYRGDEVVMVESKTWLPGKVLKQIQLPDEVQQFSYISIEFLKEENRFRLHLSESPGLVSWQRFLDIDSWGNIEHQQDFPFPDEPKPTIWSRVSILPTILLPTGIVLLILLFDALRQMMWGTSLSTFLSPFFSSWWFLLLPGLLMLIGSLIAIYRVKRLAEQYNFTDRERHRWMFVAGFLGITGLLLLYAMRNRPHREECASCRKKTVVDQKSCQHCGAEFPRTVDGRTILSSAEFEGSVEYDMETLKTTL